MVKKKDEVIEFAIHDHAIEIVHAEIREIKRKRGLDADDIVKLEKLVRVYTTLMDNLRANIKEGLSAKLVEQEADDGDK